MWDAAATVIIELSACASWSHTGNIRAGIIWSGAEWQVGHLRFYSIGNARAVGCSVGGDGVI